MFYLLSHCSDLNIVANQNQWKDHFQNVYVFYFKSTMYVYPFFAAPSSNLLRYFQNI